VTGTSKTAKISKRRYYSYSAALWHLDDVMVGTVTFLFMIFAVFSVW